MNKHIRTVIVAPMTTAGKDYPTRIQCKFKRKKGQIVLDQIRTIDKTRLIKKLGTIDPNSQIEVIAVLQRLFAF
jgi:mRNA interferase MazF